MQLSGTPGSDRLTVSYRHVAFYDSIIATLSPSFEVAYISVSSIQFCADCVCTVPGARDLDLCSAVNDILFI